MVIKVLDFGDATSIKGVYKWKSRKAEGGSVNQAGGVWDEAPGALPFSAIPAPQMIWS